MTMQWFFASLLFASQTDLMKERGQRCNVLMKAEKPAEALDKARLIGSKRQSSDCLFVGVEELLAIDGEIEDGVETIWREETLTKLSAYDLFESVGQQDKHSLESPSPSGWYAGEVVLAEVFESTVLSEDILIWRNTYLITAPTASAAKEKLQDFGLQEEEAGKHQSDGMEANWSFKGILKLVALLEPPGDGSVLWCDDLKGSVTELAALIPAEDELGLFKWLRDREHHTSHGDER